MLLENKNAVIYGAGGSVGGAVARAFAREGARVFLTGRNVEAINTLAKEISAAGGTAETAQVDALDEQAVEGHLDTVVDKAEKIDISFNAIGIVRRANRTAQVSRSTPSGFRNKACRASPSPSCRWRVFRCR